MRKHFDEQEKLRERVLASSRQVVRSAARAIVAMHRRDQAKVDEMLAQARAGLTGLAEAMKAEPRLADSGTILTAQREYCEAALLQALISEGKLPEPEELDVPYKPYLAALADATGELRRHALDLIRADEVTAAERTLGLMEDIFELLMGFDYPDAVIPGMKRRQDMVRRTLERTRGDLTIALRQQKLEKALKRAERVTKGE
jgi:translin